MKRTILPLFLLLFLAGALVAAENETGDSPNNSVTGNRFIFLSVNPGAALSLVNAGFVIHTILPTALFGQEAGVALGIGLHQNSTFSEVRLCIGNSNAYYLLLQTQFSWNWFFGESAGWLKEGPYGGVGLRYWDLVQVHAWIHNHNSVPLLNLGWWFGLGRMFIDIRLSQVIAIASWSNIPYSTAGFAWIFSPLPGVSPWMPIGMVQVGVRL